MSSHARKLEEKKSRKLGSTMDLANSVNQAMRVHVEALRALGCPFDGPADVIAWGKDAGGLVAVCREVSDRLALAETTMATMGFCPCCFRLSLECRCVAPTRRQKIILLP